MTNEQMKQAFRRMHKGRNFMTPDIIGWYGNDSDTIAELSAGRSIYGAPLYGVTVVRIEQGEPVRDTDSNEAFSSRTEAEDYALTLADGMKAA